MKKQAVVLGSLQWAPSAPVFLKLAVPHQICGMNTQSVPYPLHEVNDTVHSLHSMLCCSVTVFIAWKEKARHWIKVSAVPLPQNRPPSMCHHLSLEQKQNQTTRSSTSFIFLKLLSVTWWKTLYAKKFCLLTYAAGRREVVLGATVTIFGPFMKNKLTTTPPWTLLRGQGRDPKPHHQVLSLSPHTCTCCLPPAWSRITNRAASVKDVLLAEKGKQGTELHLKRIASGGTKRLYSATRKKLTGQEPGSIKKISPTWMLPPNQWLPVLLTMKGWEFPSHQDTSIHTKATWAAGATRTGRTGTKNRTALTHTGFLDSHAHLAAEYRLTAW